jgi:uncharacterized damage-inducible protein DinB
VANPCVSVVYSLHQIHTKAPQKLKLLALFSLAFLAIATLAQDQKEQKPATLRSVLLEQLKTTHDKNDWFVSPSKSVEGLAPEQVTWTDGKGNHSIGQLAYHLVFWNSQELAKFKGEKPAKFDGNNDETYNNFDAKTWAATVRQLDQVMTDLEKFVETATDTQLAKFGPEIAHIGTHNAYHTGQIIYIRRLQGSWDPAKGVK